MRPGFAKLCRGEPCVPDVCAAKIRVNLHYLWMATLCLPASGFRLPALWLPAFRPLPSGFGLLPSGFWLLVSGLCLPASTPCLSA